MTAGCKICKALGMGVPKELHLSLSYQGSYSQIGHNEYFSHLFKGRYDPVPWLTLQASVPLIWMEGHIEPDEHGTLEPTCDEDGHEIVSMTNPGDVNLAVEISILGLFNSLFSTPLDLSKLTTREEIDRAHRRIVDEKTPFYLFLGINLTAPTGKSTAGRFAPDGDWEFFPPELQSGGGIWRPELSLSAFKSVGHLFPLAMVSYTYARTRNHAGYLPSDALTLAAGLMGVLMPEINLRATGTFIASWNLQEVQFSDAHTGEVETLDGSRGWLFYLTIDVSLELIKGLPFTIGCVIPLGKTLEESPNDLDFLIKAGIEIKL